MTSNQNIQMGDNCVMRKMLYLMNVDWNWIKQRPHFIAEELKNDFDLTIVNQHRYTKKGHQHRELDESIFTMKVIPRIDRYKCLRWINVLLKRRIIGKLVKEKSPEYIYITDPNQIEWMPSHYKGKLIYDCMDDHIGLARTNDIKTRLEKNEKYLAEKANYILFSSNYLKNLFHSRYRVESQIKEEIVRNGFDGKILEVSEPESKNRYTICYFGTISDWFDFDVILSSLNHFSNINYLLIGPMHHGVKIPENDRINYIGTVEHDKLYETTRDVDCFVMPFKLDDSIKAVDPVKLYEYINFGKNILCVEYDEIERFSDFVCFYNNTDEYNRQIKSLITERKVKYSKERRESLLGESTWESRKKQILKLLTE